jgi:hypothetical protein
MEDRLVVSTAPRRYNSSKNKNQMKTAVQTISEAFDKYLAYSVEGSHKAEPFSIEDLSNVIFKALEMEKQQIIEAYDEAEGWVIGKGEDYYKKNYESDSN